MPSTMQTQVVRKSKSVCKYWRAGKCSRRTCTFQHTGPGAANVRITDRHTAKGYQNRTKLSTSKLLRKKRVIDYKLREDHRYMRNSRKKQKTNKERLRNRTRVVREVRVVQCKNMKQEEQKIEKFYLTK